jgi:predicted amidohydrolase
VLTEVCDLPAYLPPEIMMPFVDFRGQDNVNFFSRIAKENKCNISFSTITRGKGDYYLNTAYVLNRDGDIAGVYHKNHITQGENTWNMRYGIETPLIELDFGRVICAICFDINFEELLIRCRALNPELIIFSSQFHGGLLQQIWANTAERFLWVLSPISVRVRYLRH